MSDIDEYLKGKRVVLVGPSASIIGSQKGSEIEACDVVCRLNHAIPVPTELKDDIGSRTDILYSTVKIPKTLNPDVELIKNKVNWIVTPYPRELKPFDRYIKNFESVYNGKIPFSCPYDVKEYMKVENAIGKRPTIGLSSIVHLLSCQISELLIVGMTFFYKTKGNDGGYYEQYKDKKDYKNKTANESEVMKFVNRIGVHDPRLELEYMKKIYEKDSRVVLDNALMELIK